MSDLIKREDAIKAIHNYWKKRLDTLPTKESEYGEVYADIQQMDKILEHNKALCNFIEAVPSADRPTEVIYGNEHNCIMTIFGECSYAETGCGDCAVVEKVRKALSADRPQEWIPCSERLPSNFSEDETVLATTDVDGDRVIPMFAFDVKSFYLKGYISAWMPLPKPWKGADDE